MNVCAYCPAGCRRWCQRQEHSRGRLRERKRACMRTVRLVVEDGVNARGHHRHVLRIEVALLKVLLRKRENTRRVRTKIANRKKKKKMSGRTHGASPSGVPVGPMYSMLGGVSQLPSPEQKRG